MKEMWMNVKSNETSACAGDGCSLILLLAGKVSSIPTSLSSVHGHLKHRRDTTEPCYLLILLLMIEAESSSTVQSYEDLDSSCENHHSSNQGREMAFFWLKLQRNSLLRHLNSLLCTSLVPVMPCRNSKANRFSSPTPRKCVKYT